MTITKKELYARTIAYFEQAMPTASSELHYGNAYELLVAVMLSAQCTDKRVNMVTPALFAAYPDARSLAAATPDEVLQLIHSISYPNSKSRHLVEAARRLVEVYGGEVPADIDALQTLPGVGRKSANVMAAVFFDMPAMPVDTHVFRVANRIGLTHNSKTPLQTERELTNYIPADKLAIAHHWLILHGRYVCQARKPRCPLCSLREICRYGDKTPAPSNP